MKEKTALCQMGGTITIRQIIAIGWQRAGVRYGGKMMQFQPLIEAINFKGVVSGLTHDFYHYPRAFLPRLPAMPSNYSHARRILSSIRSWAARPVSLREWRWAVIVSA